MSAYYEIAIRLRQIIFLVIVSGLTFADGARAGSEGRIVTELKRMLGEGGDVEVVGSDVSGYGQIDSPSKGSSARFLVLAEVLETNGLSVVRCGILDQQLGLKLYDETMPYTESILDTVCQAVVARFQTVRAKVLRPDVMVVAVAPPENEDLDFRAAFLQRGLAVLAEHALLGYANVVAVAWDESSVLGTRVVGAPSQAYPNLIMLEGSFSTTSTTEGERIRVTLTARQRGRPVASETIETSDLLDLPARLSVVLPGMIASMGPVQGGSVDAGVLCDEILGEARNRSSVGDWGVAHSLAQFVVSLCPDRDDARVLLLRNLCELSSLDHASTVRERWIPTDHVERRVWVAESGIDSMGHLLRPMNLGDDITHALTEFRQCTMIYGYDFDSDPSRLRDRFRAFCDRRARLYEAVFEECLGDSACRSKMAGHWITEIVYFADMEMLVDTDAALSRITTAIAATAGGADEMLLALRALVRASTYKSLTEDGMFDRLLAPLESSPRSSVATAVELARLFSTVTDRPTHAAALRAIDGVVAREGLDAGARQAILQLLDLGLRMRSVSLDPDPSQDTPVRIPNLEDVSGELRTRLGGSPPTGVWITDPSVGDVIATPSGLHQLTPEGGARTVARGRVYSASAAGGLIWAVGPGYILCHDLEAGREARVALDGMQLENLDRAVLCAAGEQRAFVVGCNESDRSALRTWYLRATYRRDTTAIELEIIHDARLQGKRDDLVNPESAFFPEWMLRVPARSGERGDHILVGRRWFTQPVVISADRGEVRIVPEEWPLYNEWPYFCSRAVLDGTRLFILSGQFNRGAHWSAVHLADPWNRRPGVIADFGTRSAGGYEDDYPPYVRSAVVVDGVLHVLSRSPTLAPQWVALDLKTRQTWQLMTRAPLDQDAELIQSPSFGLVLRSGASVFRVSLPDRAEWMSYPPAPQDVVHFRVNLPNARSVCVVGEFNNWDFNRTLLSRDDTGTWYGTICLARGDYAYKLVADGQWILDPGNAATREVGGHVNSLLSTSDARWR